MRYRHSGVSLVGLIVILAILVFVALFAFKLLPSFMEYRSAKGAIEAIVRERPNATAADMRKAFESRSAIEGIETIKPTDLDIKQGSISFAYRREIPLFKGIGLYIDYSASAGGQ
jgi:hypothetical protein